MTALVYICYGVIGTLTALIVSFPIAVLIGRTLRGNSLSVEEIEVINSGLGIALTREDLR